MTSNVADVRTYSFVENEDLFLDANIWLIVFGPSSPRNRRVDAYSRAFRGMLSNQCRIHLDVLVLSEFINRYARLKWSIASKPCGDFKQFRNSPEFRPLAEEIAANAKRVLGHCTRIDNGFDTVDIAAVMDEFSDGSSDFNDQIIASLCLRQGLKLVTDDADFGNRGIHVLTANNRLLRC